MIKGKQRGLIAWMAGNSVAANLLMLSLLAGGLIVMRDIKQEVFPEFELDVVEVSVAYPGASPEEVERGVILAVEEEIRELEGVDRVTSTAFEQRARIMVELFAGADANKALQDIKGAVDRVGSFPDDAERPQVSLRTHRHGVMRLAVYGDADERTMYNFAQGVREELLGLATVSQVELRGVRRPEISVEIPQAALRAHGLTLDEVARAIGAAAVDVPGGGVKTEGGEVLLRTSERREFASEFSRVALISAPDGTEVKLGDIARITDGFADTEREAYFNSKRAILIYVYRTGKQTPIEISKDVRRYLESLVPTLPEGVGVSVYSDRSEIYRARRDLLLKNGGMGLALVLITLGLFLEARLAFWVAMGIPISIIGSFVLLPIAGGSINMVSLFAFIITLGIVVDDAVVVGENIFQWRQEDITPLEASVQGVREMAPVVVYAVVTNVIAFMPLLFVPGTMGQFFSILPAVVITVFLISLVESLLVLPAHLSYRRTKARKGFMGLMDRVPAFFGGKLRQFIERLYRPVLVFSISNRYLMAAAGTAILVTAYAYLDSGWINFSFRPRIQTDRIDAEVTLPFGSPVEEVRRIARLIEEGGRRAATRAGGVGGDGGGEIYESILTDVGRRGSNTAEVSFHLVPQAEREVTTRGFSILWREEVGDIPGLESLFFDYLVGPGGSKAINVELTHPDPGTLELAATDLAAAVRGFEGVTDIDDGFARGKQQLDFRMTPAGRSLGLDAKGLGAQVRHAFQGAEALRQQRGRDEVRVVVRLPLEERRSLYKLENLTVRTPQGGEVPLSSAATVVPGRAYTEINRIDGKRILSVTANVVPGVANENKILASLEAGFLPKLLQKYPGLKYYFGGRQREQLKALNSLFMGLGFTLLAIFVLLAVLFRSYLQTLFVMLIIPFGLSSALAGHILMGYDLSVISLFGMLALTGVVINGALVLTFTANRMRDGGKSYIEAAEGAGLRRFRPVMLTGLTTFFGLAPMIFESSVQARFLIPMAISLGFGILFSTGVLLLITPVFYAIHGDILKAVGKTPGRRDAG